MGLREQLRRRMVESFNRAYEFVKELYPEIEGKVELKLMGRTIVPAASLEEDGKVRIYASPLILLDRASLEQMFVHELAHAVHYLSELEELRKQGIKGKVAVEEARKRVEEEKNYVSERFAEWLRSKYARKTSKHFVGLQEATAYYAEPLLTLGTVSPVVAYAMTHPSTENTMLALATTLLLLPRFLTAFYAGKLRKYFENGGRPEKFVAEKHLGRLRHIAELDKVWIKLFNKLFERTYGIAHRGLRRTSPHE